MRKNRSTKRRGRGLKQKTIHSYLVEIGRGFGYRAWERQGLPRHMGSKSDLEFRPDVFWDSAVTGSQRTPRVWEVEKHVTSQTISKSILSLLTAIAHFQSAQAKNAEGIMVVPDNYRQYAMGRLRSAVRSVRALSAQRKGKPRRIRLGVVTFDEVQRVWKIVEVYRRGAPPKLKISWVS